MYATGLSLHFGKCFSLGCKGLRLELCKALKGEEENHLFLWLGKKTVEVIGTASPYTPVLLSALISPSVAVNESWSHDLTLYEGTSVFSQPLLELCSPCTNND